jgi:hypothetical protein
MCKLADYGEDYLSCPRRLLGSVKNFLRFRVAAVPEKNYLSWILLCYGVSWCLYFGDPIKDNELARL